MLLHTHSVMSYILALTALGMFMHIVQLRQPVNARRWLLFFYCSLLIWQTENMFRYSSPMWYYHTSSYKFQTVFILIPAIGCTLIAHTQYAYRFLVPAFLKEARLVLKLSIAFTLSELLFVAYNEFIQDGGLAITLFSAFLYSLFFTFFLIILSLRKAAYLKNRDAKASKAHKIYAVINTLYAGASIFSIAVGFFSPVGFFSYFFLVWIGNLISIVLYIVTAAIPASFQTKITGYTFVLAATLLSLVTLIVYPPVLLEDTAGRMAQQAGLTRLLIIISLAVLMIVTLMPFMLRISLTHRIEGLLDGVRKVNAGQLDTKVDVGLPDEIGMLTENFNQMTKHLEQAQASLTDYAQTLEKKVTLRTEELEKTLNEVRRLQAQQIQAEKIASMAQLTAALGHEIKNPLNFITNFSQISVELANELEEEIKKPNPDPQTLKEISEDIVLNLERIDHHGKRADAIVHGMLEHSRSGKGEPVLTDLNMLVDEYRRISYDSFFTKDKIFCPKILTHFDSQIGEIRVVKEDIGRVLLNVFNNAFYALREKMKAGGQDYAPTLWISTCKVQQEPDTKDSGTTAVARITIKDNGTGIPTAVIPKIFEPFFTTKPTGQGTGLGLSLSHDIIKAHGGVMTATSEEGEFTSFEIVLPF